MEFAIVIPVYNEAPTLSAVLEKLAVYKDAKVVVVDDGSTDNTPAILERARVHAVIRHEENQGYGQTLMDGFNFALREKLDYCVTMDADFQHEPGYIPCFLEKADKFDIVSGSRYLDPMLMQGQPPADRLEINRIITEKLREVTGYPLTDSFCGFKCYKVPALGKLRLTETNYGFPIQVWLQAAKAGLSVTECAIPLIYRDHSRNFNNQFASRDERLAYYWEVLERESAGLKTTKNKASI